MKAEYLTMFGKLSTPTYSIIGVPAFNIRTEHKWGEEEITFQKHPPFGRGVLPSMTSVGRSWHVSHSESSISSVNVFSLSILSAEEDLYEIQLQLRFVIWFLVIF